jgi:chromosome segregation ATPase
MRRMKTIELPDGLLELRDALELDWPQISARIDGPRNEGDDDDDGGKGADDDDEGGKNDDDEPTVESLQEQLAESRKREAKTKRELAAAKGAATKAAKAAAAGTTTTKKTGDDDTAAARQAAEDARKELDELKAEQERLKSELTKSAATGIARGLGFKDPEDAVNLLRWDEIADPADRAEVRDALKALKKEKPYLAGETKEKVGGGSGTRKTGGLGESMNDLIRSSAGVTPS